MERLPTVVNRTGNVGLQKLGKQNGKFNPKERACTSSIPALHLKKFKCKFQSSRNETKWKKFIPPNVISTLLKKRVSNFHTCVYIYISLKFDFSFQWDSSESEYSEPEESNELGAIVSPEIYAMDTVDSASKRQATRVFKKSSLNGKITVYLGKRDFVDHITHVDPIGKILQLYSSRSPSPSLRVYLLNITWNAPTRSSPLLVYEHEFIAFR